MTTWPSTNKAVTTTTDSDTDTISGARVDINKTIANVNDIIDIFNIPASPTNDHILKYDTATGKFQMEADSGGGGGGGNAFTNIDVGLGSYVVTDYVVTDYFENDLIQADSSTDTLTFAAGTGISFAQDTSTDTITVNSTATGDVVDDTTPQLGGDLDLNGSDITGTGNINITNTGTSTAQLALVNTDAGSSAAPIIDLKRDSASPSNGDYLGQIKFKGESSTGVERVYAKISGKIGTTTNGDEDGVMELMVKKDGSNKIAVRLNKNDLQLLNTTGLTTTDDIDINGNNLLGVDEVRSETGVLTLRTGPLGTENSLELSSNSGLELKSPGSDLRLTTTSGQIELDADTNVNALFTLKNYTVAGLPSSGVTKGAIALVTDQSTVTGGHCLVFYNGSAWKLVQSPETTAS